MYSKLGSHHSPWRYQGKSASERLIDPATVPMALQALNAAGFASDPALTWYEGGTRTAHWTYSELVEEILRIAAALKSEHRLRMGDRVVVMSSNCPEAYMVYIAIMWIGAVAVPVNNQESERVLSHIVDRVRPVLTILGRGVGLNPARLPQRFATISASTLMSEADSAERGQLTGLAPPAPDDLAVILFTSGTTSSPKGVCLTHYNLLINAEGLKLAHSLSSNRSHLCVLPLFHANAFGFSMVASIHAGCHVVLCDGLPGPAIWTIARDEQVNIISAVPEILRLLGARRIDRGSVARLRYVVSAAAPLSKAIVSEFEKNTGVAIHQGYGLSECTNFATTLPYDVSEETRKRLMSHWNVPSIGPALFGTEVRIQSANGKEAAEEEEGEILIAGHNVMRGYWEAPDETHETLRDGWLHSGDLGFFAQVDGVQHFFVTGRLKELIIRCGDNISPRSVEEELACLGELGPFAACGFKNEATGEEIGLYVQAEWSDTTRQRIQAALEVCPLRYRPRVAIVGAEPILATVTGKIKRDLLAKHFESFEQTVFGSRPRVVVLQ